jgi:hypothetical protein
MNHVRLPLPLPATGTCPGSFRCAVASTSHGKHVAEQQRPGGGAARCALLVVRQLSVNKGGRPAYPLKAMLRIHLMHNWFRYSGQEMEKAFDETTALHQFAGLSLERIPDETTCCACWKSMS